LTEFDELPRTLLSVLDLQADQGVITGTETPHPLAQKRLALEDAFAISIDADAAVAIRGYACATRMASARAHFEFDER